MLLLLQQGGQTVRQVKCSKTTDPEMVLNFTALPFTLVFANKLEQTLSGRQEINQVFFNEGIPDMGL